MGLASPFANTSAGIHPAHFLSTRAWHLRWSDINRSVSLARDALDHCDADPKGAALHAGHAHLVLAWHTKWRGYLAQSEFHRAESLDNLKRAKSDTWIPLVHSIESIAAFVGGDFGACERALKTARKSFDGETPDEAMADLLCSLATHARILGDFELACRYLDRALVHGKGPDISRVHQNIARCLIEFGQHQRALPFALRSLASAHLHNNRSVLPYAHELLGRAHTHLGNHVRAAEALLSGQKIARANQDIRVMSQLGIARGALEARLGNHSGARDCIEMVVSKAERSRFGLHVEQARSILGLVA